MRNLISTELKKIFKSNAAKLCFLLLTVIMFGMIITEYNDMAAYRNNAAYREELMSWQEREQNMVKFAGESLQDPWYNSLQKEQISRRIEIAKYRLENNIPKDIYKNVWWFFNDKAFNTISIVTIFMMIIIGSMSIAGEYNQRTLRQVLLLPYKRWKILLAKFLAVGITGAMLYSLVFLLGLLSGFFIHGTEGLHAQVVLYFGEHITTMNMSLYSILIVLLKGVEIAFYTSLVLMLCVWTRSTTGTTLITAVLAVFGVPLGNFLASYYSSVNYLPFMNLDFRRYLDFGTIMPEIEAFWNTPVVQGITPVISAMIVMGTMALFIGISFAIFNTQDI